MEDTGPVSSQLPEYLREFIPQGNRSSPSTRQTSRSQAPSERIRVTVDNYDSFNFRIAEYAKRKTLEINKLESKDNELIVTQDDWRMVTAVYLCGYRCWRKLDPKNDEYNRPRYRLITCLCNFEDCDVCAIIWKETSNDRIIRGVVGKLQQKWMQFLNSSNRGLSNGSGFDTFPRTTLWNKQAILEEVMIKMYHGRHAICKAVKTKRKHTFIAPPHPKPHLWSFKSNFIPPISGPTYSLSNTNQIRAAHKPVATSYRKVWYDYLTKLGEKESLARDKPKVVLEGKKEWKCLREKQKVQADADRDVHLH